MASTDARPVPRKNTAFRLYLAIRKTDGSLITSWTGQDSEVSLDGAAFADCTNEATEIGTSGCGYIDLTAAEMNADCVVYKLTVTNSGALTIVLTLFPEELGDYRVDAVGSVTGNVGGNVVGSVNSVATAITLPTIPANWITAAGIATDAIGSDEIAASAVTKIQSGLATPTNITGGTITTVTNLTNAPTSGDLTAAMKASVTAAVPSVVQIQSGLATSSAVSSLQTSVDDLPTNAELAAALASSDDATLAALGITTGYALTSMRAAVVILGTISNAGTAAEQYTYGGVTVTYAGLDAAGNRSGVTIT